MRQAVMIVAMLAFAETGGAGEGFFSFPFNEEDCVNVVISTPTWRLNTAKRTAANELRKPTAAELNVGTSFEILIWNEERA